MTKRGLNIFLVDDDRIYQFTARKIIESFELVNRIDVFSNGLEAIAYLQQQSLDEDDLPDVIFLDINMPEMNGWEFLESFHGLYKNLKKPSVIFMVSSSVDESDIQRSKQFTLVSSYLNKPLGREKFHEILEPLFKSLKSGN